MLADSNILIYCQEVENVALRLWLKTTCPAISAITQVEVLGFHRITLQQLAILNELIDALDVIYPSKSIVERAISLRQQRKMSLGDALIAATCLEHNEQLATANVDDFKWIAGLDIVNPLASLDV